MSQQVTRSLAAFVSGLLLAALAATVPASAAPGGRADSVKGTATSTATLKSPKFTEPLGRKMK